ncbi:MAG: DUF1203 domain-containing protein [Stenotrophomonas sp.]
MHTWHLSGIDHQRFLPLFDASDGILSARGIVRRRADDRASYPCRISLTDAAPGAELLLLPYVHLQTHSPYRASGPIFIQRGATRCVLPPGAVPPYVQRRLISLRAYDSADLMLGGQVCEGAGVAEQLDRLFADTAVAFVQLHNAGYGCFSCQADRVRTAPC